jgi:hypothetical protein
VKKGTKRASQGEKARPNKRQKKEETPSDVSEDEVSEASFSEESAVSDFEESDASEAPKPKRQSKSKSHTPVKRGSKKVIDSDDSEEEELSDGPEDEDSEAASTPPKKSKKETASRRQSKRSVVESDEDSEEEEKPKKVSPVKNPTPKKNTPKKSTPKKPAAEVESKVDDSESEMSVVLDEPPKPKQKRRTKSEMAAGNAATRGEKAPRAAKTKKEPKPAKDLTPQEGEIKTLQSHLVKCGVRKIWGFELKPYGDDSKAKIRHLQGMLKEVGMVGRFSEQRAREIKELRELQADLEAVKEGDSKWGLESGRRNRGVRKSFKESTDAEDEDEEGGAKAASSGGESTPRRKMAKAKQELAFLSDEDSSDSD